MQDNSGKQRRFQGGRREPAAPPWASQGGAPRPPELSHPPEHIFAPPKLLSLLRFINSNSLKKSIIFIITGWFYVVLSFSLYSYKLWHYMYNMKLSRICICWLARIYVYPTSDSIPKHLWICMIFGGIRKIFNPVFFHSLLDQEFDRKGFCMLFVMLLPSPLKELYTSETTLLTPRALWITSWN